MNLDPKIHIPSVRSRRERDMEDIPTEFRPPRMWPTVLLAALTFAMSIYATNVSYRNSHDVEKVNRRIATNTEIRCKSERARFRIPPKTPMEEYLRDLSIKTYAEDGCSKTK